jgi:hypothetical protein
MVKSELSGCRPQVAFFKEVSVHFVVYQDPDPDIELPAMDQERPLYILLDHKTCVIPDFVDFLLGFSSFRWVHFCLLPRRRYVFFGFKILLRDVDILNSFRHDLPDLGLKS